MGLALIYLNHQECWAMFQRKYLGDDQARSSLPPTDAAQPGLVLDDAVGSPILQHRTGRTITIYEYKETCYFKLYKIYKSLELSLCNNSGRHLLIIMFR